MSPCIRRQYGSVIARIVPSDIRIEDIERYAPNVMEWHVAESNSRVSKCCDGTCARDRFETHHGQRTEVGAEIHSETATLIRSTIPVKDSHFILVGFEGNHQLYGTDVYPCAACIKAIKFAGYKYIYIRDGNKSIVPVSVNEILKYREAQWESDV